MPNEYSKPLPRPISYDQEFWNGLKRHELLIQRCTDCGAFRCYPRPMCPNCHSMNLEWVRSSGKGKIFAYTIVQHPIGSKFDEEIPYAVVLAELEDAGRVRLGASIIGGQPEEVKIDLPVEVVFDDVTPEFTLLRWKLVR